MGFKENLLKKIKIDHLAKQVLASISHPDSDLRIDKTVMKSLLEMAPYKPVKERDLELYIQDISDGLKKIIVLDNELPIYKTTIADVALRKSPTIKEMINIRNAIKIINDKDVKVSRKKQSLEIIQKECIDLIDLSFEKSDLEDIENDGVISLDRGYTEGVIESIVLFSALLGYKEAPKAFQINHCKLIGTLTKKETGEMLLGPVVIYNIMHNILQFIQEPVSSLKESHIRHLHSVAAGKEKALYESAAVLGYLKNEILKKKGNVL